MRLSTLFLPRHSILAASLSSISLLSRPAAAQNNGDNNLSSSTTSSSDKPSSTSSDVRITGSSASNGRGAVTASLTGVFGIPTYPAASVPPTNDAPFMKQSNVPEGTVFIAVGAILGAFLFAVLLWRVIVSALLRKSVDRAAFEQTKGSKMGHSAPASSPYKYSDHTSTLSLGNAISVPKGTRRTNRGNTPSVNASSSNLFFSPTATNNNQANARSSTFLPSGFYASSTGTLNQSQSIGMTNLQPGSRGHYASNSRGTLNDTPPGSPYTHARRDVSTSSINLNRPLGTERAPSAYLDDLLADDPSAFPPPHMPSQTGSYGSGRSSPAGRY